jgi:uncharacterized membrane protein
MARNIENISPAARDADERTRKVELLISGLLRTGVLTSLTIVVFGTILSFIHHPLYLSSPAELERILRADGTFPHTIGAVLNQALHLKGQGVIMFGLFLLIATPIMRVAVSIVAFIYQRDRTFVIITSVVLALLAASFFLGKGGG